MKNEKDSCRTNIEIIRPTIAILSSISIGHVIRIQSPCTEVAFNVQPSLLVRSPTLTNILCTYSINRVLSINRTVSRLLIVFDVRSTSFQSRATHCTYLSSCVSYRWQARFSCPVRWDDIWGFDKRNWTIRVHIVQRTMTLVAVNTTAARWLTNESTNWRVFRLPLERKLRILVSIIE